MGWLDEISDVPWQQIWEDIQKTQAEWTAAMPVLSEEQPQQAQEQVAPQQPTEPVLPQGYAPEPQPLEAPMNILPQKATPPSGNGMGLNTYMDMYDPSRSQNVIDLIQQYQGMNTGAMKDYAVS